MSYCRRDDINRYEHDYSYQLESDCHHQRCRRSTFPRVLQANLIIPQTVIPVTIVLSPLGTPIITPVTTAGIGTTLPLSANLLPGNGIFPGL
ncbi:MAG: hypothetical protein PHD15_06380 [Clostridia bacterium]|nr:hypothetical protein [Clostridia bacterium]MDD4387357.1 hypothetical protein [Clostridia bacterium]